MQTFKVFTCHIFFLRIYFCNTGENTFLRVVGVSKTSSEFSNSLELTGCQQILILTAKIYYSRRIQSKISQRKRHMEWSLEKTKHKLPVEYHRTYLLQHQIVTIRVQCPIPWKLIRDSGNDRNQLKSNFPKANQEPNLEAGLSKGGPLKPVVLTLFYTLPKWGLLIYLHMHRRYIYFLEGFIRS